MDKKHCDQAMELLEYKAAMNRLDWERLEPAYAELLLNLDNSAFAIIERCCDQRYMPDISEIKNACIDAKHQATKGQWKGYTLEGVLRNTKEQNRRDFAEGFYGTSQLSQEVEEWIAGHKSPFPGMDPKNPRNRELAQRTYPEYQQKLGDAFRRAGKANDNAG